MNSRVLAFAFVAFAACSDSSSAPRVPELPPASGAVLGEFRITVNAETQTMSFQPIVVGSRTRARPEGLSLATYGTQNSDVRLYNNGVVVTTPNGRKQFTADVGLTNLKTLAIGDEQLSSGAAPRDTMGIYVFQSNPVIACAPAACDVQIFNQHGTGTFTAPNQKYFWYRDRVMPSANVRSNSGCTVGTAGYAGCQWIFDASSNTTSFEFFVQIRAAWEPVAGGDTEFPIVYEGDSLPELRAEPRWNTTMRSTGTSGWSVTEGTELAVINTTTQNVTREYIRLDSIRSADVGFIQVTMRQTTTSNKNGTYIIGYFGLDDNTRWLGVGLNKTQVGFITSALTFIGTPVTTTPAVTHTYKIVKNGTGNVQLFIDGSATPSQTLAYNSFSASVALAPADYSFFFFGHNSGSTTRGNDPPGTTWTSFWDQVVYKLGNTS